MSERIKEDKCDVCFDYQVMTIDVGLKTQVRYCISCLRREVEDLEYALLKQMKRLMESDDE